MIKTEGKKEGIVVDVVSATELTVRVGKESCKGCSIVWMCGGDKAEGTNHKVYVESSEGYKIGDRINIYEESGAEVRAIMLCLVVPMVLFVVSIVAGAALYSQIAGGLLGLCVMGFYFGAMYLLRNKNYINPKFYSNRN